MPDREKVIKGLNDIGGFIAGRIGFEQARNFMRTLDDTVALLKEQQEQIDRLIEENASNAEMAEGLKELLKVREAVVHCKDCKHFTEPDEYGFGVCMKIMHGCQSWGYCADGEAKE